MSASTNSPTLSFLCQDMKSKEPRLQTELYRKSESMTVTWNLFFVSYILNRLKRMRSSEANRMQAEFMHRAMLFEMFLFLYTHSRLTELTSKLFFNWSLFLSDNTTKMSYAKITCRQQFPLLSPCVISEGFYGRISSARKTVTKRNKQIPIFLDKCRQL